MEIDNKIIIRFQTISTDSAAAKEPTTTWTLNENIFDSRMIVAPSDSGMLGTPYDARLYTTLDTSSAVDTLNVKWSYQLDIKQIVNVADKELFHGVELAYFTLDLGSLPFISPDMYRSLMLLNTDEKLTFAPNGTLFVSPEPGNRAIKLPKLEDILGVLFPDNAVFIKTVDESNAWSKYGFVFCVKPTKKALQAYTETLLKDLGVEASTDSDPTIGKLENAPIYFEIDPLVKVAAKGSGGKG